MPRRTKKTEDEKTIPEMAEDVARVEMSLMYKDGKLTAYGRSMEKILDEALPPEKVDEWGFLLSRKEREAIKRKAEEKKRIADEKRAKAAAIRRIRRKAKEGGFGPETSWTTSRASTGRSCRPATSWRSAGFRSTS